MALLYMYSSHHTWVPSAFLLDAALQLSSEGCACSGKGGVEVLQHTHDVLALAWAPSGKMLASATLDGQIYLWDPLEAELLVCSMPVLASAETKLRWFHHLGECSGSIA